MNVLKTKPRTKDAMQEAVEHLMRNFTYRSDVVEDWSIDYSGLEDGKGLTDDCDGFTNALTRLLFSKCLFNLDEIAICIVDTNLSDDKQYDHIIVGVRISGKEYFAHNWTDQVLTRRDIELGGYEVEGGKAVGMSFVQFRILSTNKDSWLKGYPDFV